jgi:hypothetical protein
MIIVLPLGTILGPSAAKPVAPAGIRFALGAHASAALPDLPKVFADDGFDVHSETLPKPLRIVKLQHFKIAVQPINTHMRTRFALHFLVAL